MFDKKNIFKRKGYLNKVIKKNNMYIRKPKMHFSNWENEKNIYKQLNIEIKTRNNGFLQRKWIHGQNVKKWDEPKIQSLIIKIEEFHNLDSAGISSHDWNKYNYNFDKINFSKADFLDLQKMISQDKVVSHNDINSLNVLWNGEEIILIDFEWANLNHKLFDYVQFFIAENILLVPKTKEFDILLKLSLVYALLWTHDAPKSKDVLKWRKRYNALLEKL